MKRKTLLMFSGGLDSTACLLKLLENTDDQIFLHYVDVSNNKHKAWCEQNARQAILKEIDKAFSKKRIEERFISEMGFDKAKQCGVSLQPALWMMFAALHLTSMVTTVKKGDKPVKLRLCLGYTDGDSAAEDIDLIKRQWFGIWRSVNIEDPVPELYTPILRTTKQKSIDYIRRVERRYKDLNIVNNIWTCEGVEFIHSPHFSGYAPCLTCGPCKRALEIGLIDKNRIPGAVISLENLLDKKAHID